MPTPANAKRNSSEAQTLLTEPIRGTCQLQGRQVSYDRPGPLTDPSGLLEVTRDLISLFVLFLALDSVARHSHMGTVGEAVRVINIHFPF